MDDQKSTYLSNQTSHIIQVPNHVKSIRLDVFLLNYLSEMTRSQIQKQINDGTIKVNDSIVKPSHKVSPGESICVWESPKPSSLSPAENIPLDIVYEDQHVMVVNKPAGMVVHPAYGNLTGTLVNALLFRYAEIKNVGDPHRPGIVHRLDKDTSGLLVVAKTSHAHQHLANQFKDRTIHREYHAIVWGELSETEGRIESTITRSSKDRRKMITAPEGKLAITNYSLIKQFPLAALVSIRLETGRTHQIRVHFSAIHHPVVGDPVYSGRRKQIIRLNHLERQHALSMLERIDRQALHAKQLGFKHPKTGEFLSFDSELPNDMQSLLTYLYDLDVSLQ